MSVENSNYIWLLNKKDDHSMIWSCLGSIVIHCILLAVLIIKPIYPVMGIGERIELIWLDTAFGVSGQNRPLEQPLIQEQGDVGEIKKNVTKTIPVKQASMEDATPKGEAQSPPEEVATPPAVTEPEVPDEPAAEMIVAKSDIKPDEVPQEKIHREEEKPLKPAEQEKSVAKTGVEDLKPLETGKSEKPASEVRKEDKSAVEKMLPQPHFSNHTAAARRPSPKPAKIIIASPERAGEHSFNEKLAKENINPAAERPRVAKSIKGGLSQKGVNKGAFEAERRNGAAAQTAPAAEAPRDTGEKPFAAPRENPGLFLPPLLGDLKLEVSGESGAVVTVQFKEYLKSRRQKPMTKSESKRLELITPVARTRENVQEIVVGTTGEGIYRFAAESRSEKEVEAVFVLKIFENRSRAKTLNIGKKVVGRKAVIARVLMPEGISWDDDTNFSGNIEGSDSITKYNSETGLVWKEYLDD